MATCAKISPKMVKPRYIDGNVEEERRRLMVLAVTQPALTVFPTAMLTLIMTNINYLHYCCV